MVRGPIPNAAAIIETDITKKGGVIWRGEYVDKREKLTRKTRWQQMDEDVPYSGGELDRSVVNPSQIRNVIRTFRDKLPDIFPGRQHIPKTLIFAKTDSRPLERQPTTPTKDLLAAMTIGARSEDPFSSLANRRGRTRRFHLFTFR
jgi:type I restriction enzyme R subunit